MRTSSAERAIDFLQRWFVAPNAHLTAQEQAEALASIERTSAPTPRQAELKLNLGESDERSH